MRLPGSLPLSAILWVGAAAVATALLLAAPACRRLQVDRLYALPGKAPEGVTPALPLALKAGGGNVGGGNRFADLEIDTDAVHKVAASCHHGPPVTNPVQLQVRAYYDQRELFVEVGWRDPTEDRAPRSWEKGDGGWRLGEQDEDGLAILWSRGSGRFGCQEACHMSDFAVREGTVIDLRAMRLADPGASEEAWVWKASTGARELQLGSRGFTTVPGGEVFRTLNSAAATDESLRPGARRAAAFGPGDRPLRDAAWGPLPPQATQAPAYLYAPAAGGGLLAARAQRDARGWRVVFSRPLDAGPGRQEFRPGERYRFGLALFDSTSTDHHLVRDTQVLELVVPGRAGGPVAGEARRDGDDGIL